MKVTRVLHVSLNVHGTLSEVQSFYADVLGLPSTARPEIPGVDGHWLALGDTELHLVDAEAGTDPIKPRGHHFCVAVANLDDAIAELEALGIEYKHGAQGAVRQIWIVDPAGNTVELQQDR